MIKSKKNLVSEKYIFCIPITFNNPLKVCFPNKKHPITTQIYYNTNFKSIFLIQKIFKIIGVQN